MTETPPSPAAPVTPTSPKKSGPKHSALLNILIDYGPVLAFFLAYRLFRPAHAASGAASGGGVGEVIAVTKSTLVFIAATLASLVASKLARGKIAPMLWVSAALVCGFGALTVWSQNPLWIRHKPTAVYLLFAAVLLWGWRSGKPTLRTLLESAFEGLSEEGWVKLSRNWGFFFLFFAALNEVFANDAWFSFDQWLRAKLLVFMPLSFLFTFAHMPMLLRHGLGKEAETEVLTHPPHE